MKKRYLFSFFYFFSFFCFSQNFSLEQILSAPYASTLVADQYSNRIAWVVNEKGVRNIWVASAPDFKGRQVTGFKEDDGQGISNLIFAKDKNQLIYVRGNGTNQKGELANPASFTAGVTRAIYQLNITDGSSKQLAKGSSPRLSPDGNTMLFSSGGIMQLDLTDPQAKPVKLFSARGNNGNYRFSPDGNKVVFVSARGDHNFIGVYATGAKQIQWIAPGVDRDGYPVWSPDGSQIAFIRTPGKRRGELRNLMSNTAFSIVVADVKSGKGKTIWTSPDDRSGGFAQYYPSHPIRWTKNNRILFYSEHEGWMHIYSMRPDGSQLTTLTPGACEAEHSGLSPNGKTLYFTSNCDDLERRHIWKVPSSGGAPIRCTRGDGIETDVVALYNNQHIAFRSANAKETMGIKVLDTNADKILNVFHEPVPSAASVSEKKIKEQVQPQTVIFKAADGVEVHGQLFVPAGSAASTKKPAVIFMHGGPIRQMLAGYHYSGYYANAYAMNQYLCSRGYVVLAVNFRAGIGYGRDFRLAEKQGPRGASEYQDIVAAAKYLKSRNDVNGNKIGLWGGSYGGLLTAMGLARNSDLFAAGVDLHGVHDWAWRGKDFVPGGAWGIDEALMEKAYLSSPVADVDKWKSPVLFVHGDDDRNVMFGQTVDLVQRLRERNVEMEILVFPDEVHGFLRWENWLRTFEAGAAFFDKWLK